MNVKNLGISILVHEYSSATLISINTSVSHVHRQQYKKHKAPYLNKILGKLSLQHVANHSKLTDEACTNTLQPPFPYLNSKIKSHSDNLELFKHQSSIQVMLQSNFQLIILVTPCQWHQPFHVNTNSIMFLIHFFNSSILQSNSVF